MSESEKMWSDIANETLRSHGVTVNPSSASHSAEHYGKCKIEPITYIQANDLGFEEGNVVKYVTRHQDKNGRQDLEKAIHYLQLLIASDYPETTDGKA